jgi:hypothetical protein
MHNYFPLKSSMQGNFSLLASAADSLGLQDKDAQDQAYVALLKIRDFCLPDALTPIQMKNRTNLLAWWLKNARDCLGLRWKTIDIAIRLFDLYCWRKLEQSRAEPSTKKKVAHVLDNVRESKLSLTACFFSAAKYNEIYPPCLNDFIYYDESIERSAVILREVEVVLLTKCGYTIATITDWADLHLEHDLPEWAYTCYLHAPMVSAETLAHAICQVVTNNSGYNSLACVA